jgi:mannose/cellobiose epimerase-like protein (N-acyl-D-glucosamine 2-epimerase family)
MKEHVIETIEVSSRNGVDKNINEYLKLGWILIADWVVDYGEPGHRIETAHFLLGWIDRSCRPVHPSKKKG